LHQQVELLERERAALLEKTPGLEQQCQKPDAVQASCETLRGIEVRRTRAEADAATFTGRSGRDCVVDTSFLCTAIAYWATDGTGPRISIGFLASLLALFNSFVLPVMFAMLGTLVRAFRVIREKVEQSTLAPSDRNMVLISLPLGLVAGLAVGLFFQPAAAQAGLSGTTLPISLTTSGIGFLAGYGADSFFIMLDALIKRVFNLDPQATSPRKA
jgi:hypothetical protein